MGTSDEQTPLVVGSNLKPISSETNSEKYFKGPGSAYGFGRSRSSAALDRRDWQPGLFPNVPDSAGAFGLGMVGCARLCRTVAKQNQCKTVCVPVSNGMFVWGCAVLLLFLAKQIVIGPAKLKKGSRNLMTIAMTSAWALGWNNAWAYMDDLWFNENIPQHYTGTATVFGGAVQLASMLRFSQIAIENSARPEPFWIVCFVTIACNSVSNASPDWQRAFGAFGSVLIAYALVPFVLYNALSEPTGEKCVAPNASVNILTAPFNLCQVAWETGKNLHVFKVRHMFDGVAHAVFYTGLVLIPLAIYAVWQRRKNIFFVTDPFDSSWSAFAFPWVVTAQAWFLFLYKFHYEEGDFPYWYWFAYIFFFFAVIMTVGTNMMFAFQLAVRGYLWQPKTNCKGDLVDIGARERKRDYVTSPAISEPSSPTGVD